MQQLTAPALLASLRVADDAVLIDLPLPGTVAQTRQFIDQLCRLSGAVCRETDWGADRCAAYLTCAQHRLVLHVEWLCEAIWLTADAGYCLSGQAIFDSLCDLPLSE